MTIAVWIASLLGAVLFAIVGFLLAKLTREPEPAVDPAAAKAHSAELAKLRMEIDASQRSQAAAEQGQAAAEQGQAAAEKRAQELRQELDSARAAPAPAAAADGSKLTALQGELALLQKKLATAESEHRSDDLRFRRREGSLEATLESLTKERDSAQQQVKDLERALEKMDAEPTHLDVSPAQFELLKDLLRKAEARERALAGELVELKAQLAAGMAEVDGARKPSTLVGMQAPDDEADVLGTSEFDPPLTRDFTRPKTLIGVHDPTKLYRDALSELDLTRAELEKARAEAGFWKKQSEKATSEALAASRRRTPAPRRGGARASVGLKPTATTGRDFGDDDKGGSGR